MDKVFSIFPWFVLCSIRMYQEANSIARKVSEHVAHKVDEKRPLACCHDTNGGSIEKHLHSVLVGGTVVPCILVQPLPNWRHNRGLRIRGFACKCFHVLIHEVLDCIPRAIVRILQKIMWT